MHSEVQNLMGTIYGNHGNRKFSRCTCPCSLPLPIHYQGGSLPHLVHGVVLYAQNSSPTSTLQPYQFVLTIWRMHRLPLRWPRPRCLLDSDDNHARAKIEEATKPALLLLYIHGKSTVVTIISKIRSICMHTKKCTEFSLEIVSV